MNCCVAGKPDEAASFRQQAAATLAQFNTEFLNNSTGAYWQGTQCSQALPLFLVIVPTPQLQAQVQVCFWIP